VVWEGGIASATFDFGKCTFVISIKKTTIDSQSGKADFNLTLGNFSKNEEVEIACKQKCGDFGSWYCECGG
jgi:hypothetical protein